MYQQQPFLKHTQLFQIRLDVAAVWRMDSSGQSECRETRSSNREESMEAWTRQVIEADGLEKSLEV